MHQDNKSATLLKENSCKLSGKCTQHIEIQHGFITDIKCKTARVEYCPTEEMVADFFTKPLQGRLFLKLRCIIMGETTDVTALGTLGTEHRSVFNQHALTPSPTRPRPTVM